MVENSVGSSLAQLRHVILDLDGTIYLDEQLFPETQPFLALLTRYGIGHTFVTNNNSRSRAEYIGLMKRVGLDATDSSLFTSAHATFAYLRRHFPEVRRPLVVGFPVWRRTFVLRVLRFGRR